MLKTEEKTDDVKEENADVKPEAEVKDIYCEADDSATESVKATEKNESVKVTINDEAVKENAKPKDVIVADHNEAVAKSPKANKKRKADHADNAPNKKLHEETDTLMDDADNDTANEINDASLQPESVEIEEPKVEKPVKGGKKATKAKKDVEAKSATPSSPASRTRSKKT